MDIEYLLLTVKVGFIVWIVVSTVLCIVMRAAIER